MKLRLRERVLESVSSQETKGERVTKPEIKSCDSHQMCQEMMESVNRGAVIDRELRR